MCDDPFGGDPSCWMHLFEAESDQSDAPGHDSSLVAGPEVAAPGAVNLRATAAASSSRGPIWTRRSDDLDINLLAFSAGDGVAEHRNDEVDVLLIGVAGEGVVMIDAQPHTLAAGQAILVPKGARRGTLAVSERFSYLTCHRRRPGLRLTVGARRSS